MKNSFRKIMALLMAIMMLAALGMSASAAVTVANDGTFSITKTLTKETNAYAPNTTYTFTIAKGTVDDANAVREGIEGGVLFETENGPAATLTITSTPDSTMGGEDTNVDTGKGSLTYNEKIKINLASFKDPGIYRYTVTETKGNYAGITYDTVVRTLDVYIQQNAAQEMEIAGVNMYYTAGESTDTKSTAFTNVYDTADLTVSKTVTGNLGDTTMDFTFEITVTDVAGAAESYYVTFSDGSTPATITSGNKATFHLAHGENFKVHGLSAGDKYTVTETSVAGYETSYIKTVGETADTQATKSNTVTETTIAAAAAGENVQDVTLAFTNNRQVEVPTGVAMDVLPFVAMIVVAGVLALLFFRKKERREA